jgi:hypothetical protein
MLSNTLPYILHRYCLEEEAERLGFEAKAIHTIIFDLHKEVINNSLK